MYKGGANNNLRQYSLWMRNDGLLYAGSADASGEQGLQTGTNVVTTKRRAMPR